MEQITTLKQVGDYFNNQWDIAYSLYVETNLKYQKLVAEQKHTQAASMVKEINRLTNKLFALQTIMIDLGIKKTANDEDSESV